MRMSLTFASQELHSPLQTITIFRNLNYLQHPYKHLTPERVHILLPVTEIDAVAITKKTGTAYITYPTRATTSTGTYTAASSATKHLCFDSPTHLVSKLELLSEFLSLATYHAAVVFPVGKQICCVGPTAS